ncbi:4-carboxy-4-hydroxy-2-oxoadipate aldolase/oxaloacetate decarboxylase [Rhodoligotrophos defluvii]|uniref:4-carboxy-4-hydroxy-2-oxoadipate aldolase/oxaloacetate decarboxylase n=1 Tax=Rhodoligotrophos defluvii TaxID=2561934 RepID=UPI0010C9966E|nr:4-carboxy-4-hydroxy-2-oxoadipate aldolase/oxaloacetate decarboxylase [Rhodoligotrophos defluvii]
MKGVVIRNIERAPAEVVDALARLGVATVLEAQGRRGLMHPRIRPMQGGARVAGSAVTALCPPGDNAMLHVALELLKPGDILVVAPLSDCSDAYIGDLLATACKVRGARGAVLDTGIRDLAEIRSMGFPVWARTVSAQGTVKEQVVSANVPIVCAGVHVVPGDIVVADDDGVVVVPRRQGETVLAAAEARVRTEEDIRARLEAGEVTMDVFGLRHKLAERGLRYVDGPVDWSGTPDI